MSSVQARPKAVLNEPAHKSAKSAETRQSLWPAVGMLESSRRKPVSKIAPDRM